MTIEERHARMVDRLQFLKTGWMRGITPRGIDVDRSPTNDDVFELCASGLRGVLDLDELDTDGVAGLSLAEFESLYPLGKSQVKYIWRSRRFYLVLYINTRYSLPARYELMFTSSRGTVSLISRWPFICF